MFAAHQGTYQYEHFNKIKSPETASTMTASPSLSNRISLLRSRQKTSSCRFPIDEAKKTIKNIDVTSILKTLRILFIFPLELKMLTLRFSSQGIKRLTGYRTKCGIDFIEKGLHPNLQEVVNQQINTELTSSYAYLTIVSINVKKQLKLN